MNRLGLALLLLTSLVVPHELGAQEQGGGDPGRAFLLRAELEELGVRFRAYAESPVYSERLRARARAEADLIETRLTEGDFDVGDRVVVVVEGEEALSDTFTVSMGRVLRIGEIGDVQLKGVLRSEFEPEVRQHLGRFLREPRTQTRSYLRIAVDGAVIGPGFYTVAADIALSDAIMLAGGPAENAKLSDIRVERGERRIWSGYPLQEALAGGLTIDQMRLRDGDRIYVPRGGNVLSRSGVPLLLSFAVSLVTLAGLLF